METISAAKITQSLHRLTPEQQLEVWDFIEFLRSQDPDRREELAWSSRSLAAATRGLGDEEVSYDPSDLRESWV
jgi:hypothetical protein